MTRPPANPSSVAAVPPCGGGHSEGAQGTAARLPARWRRGLRIAAYSVPLLLICYLLFAAGALKHSKARPWSSDGREPFGILPGEFERHEAILLAWPRQAGPPYPEDDIDLYRREDRLFCEIVGAIWRSVEVIILVEDAQSRDRAGRLLSQAEVPSDAARFVEVPFDSEWIRDYGPVGVKTLDGSCTMIDADYVDKDLFCFTPEDDRLPSVLGALFHMRTVRAPIAIHGGNLLSNGRGLCITTRRLLEDNAARGFDGDDITAILKRFYGAREVVFLEALRGEPTGHVDMFATFTSPDTVVVARSPHRSDPHNAEILDRNAERLASIKPPLGPLRVVRIRMPPRLRKRDGTKLWPTYTNVVFANDTLLVPVYPGSALSSDSVALGLYHELLPRG